MDPSGAIVPESGPGIRVFVGGIPVDTTQQDLIDAFSFYGKLSAARVLRDAQTGRGRGFGFIVFAHEDDAKRCCEMENRPLKDRMVTVRIADPEYGGQPQTKTYNAAAPATNGTRVFIGGMPNCSDQDIAEHFRQFGTVLATKVVTDRDTGKPRGFGFCLFSSEMEADRACAQKYQTFLGKKVEVRPADPKTGSQSSSDPYNAAASNPAAVQQYYSWLMQYQQYYLQYYMQAQALAAQQSPQEGEEAASTPVPAIMPPPAEGPTNTNTSTAGTVLPAVGYAQDAANGYNMVGTSGSGYDNQTGYGGYPQPQAGYGTAGGGYNDGGGYQQDGQFSGGYQNFPSPGVDRPGPVHSAPPLQQNRWRPY